MRVVKAVIGTTTLLLMFAVGCMLIWTSKGFLLLMGYFNVLVATLFTYFIILQYFESPFYKKLEEKE